jgi:hypothetical protein
VKFATFFKYTSDSTAIAAQRPQHLVLAEGIFVLVECKPWRSVLSSLGGFQA